MEHSVLWVPKCDAAFGTVGKLVQSEVIQILPITTVSCKELYQVVITFSVLALNLFSHRQDQRP